MKTLLTTEILKLRTIRTPWVVLGLTQAALLAGATGLLVNGGCIYAEPHPGYYHILAPRVPGLGHG